LELDPDWDEGAIREIFISLEPVLLISGGNERSKEHYEAVLGLRGGKSAGPHVSYATAVPLMTQDKDEFVRLLELALAVDIEGEPESRLANEYAQSKARFLLDHLDDLFLE
jgi:predicted anti-sigma-YlaC factor YlaD